MEEHDDEPTFEEPFKAQMERLDAEDEARAATEAALQAERDLNEALIAALIDWLNG